MVTSSEASQCSACSAETRPPDILVSQPPGIAHGDDRADREVIPTGPAKGRCAVISALAACSEAPGEDREPGDQATGGDETGSGEGDFGVVAGVGELLALRPPR